MAHDLDRLTRAFAARPWAIDEARGMEILAALSLRAARGPRAEPYLDESRPEAPLATRAGRVAVINLMGTIAPRASAVRDVSASFVSLEKWAATFRALADDAQVQAIVLNVDSPGGMVDLVPETAALVRGARRQGRPIFAVANTIAASAAYWIAAQADRFFATPSATVGSIGVRAMHVDHSAALAREGLKVTHISAGARKTEGNPHQPLDAAAMSALQASIDETYGLFVADVAAARGVAEAVVRADPEKAARHMGGGRAYSAGAALRLGMVDEIATFEAVLARAAGRSGVGVQRGRLALL